MHDSLHISAYTPSNTDPEILEKIFVQRHKLLEKTVAWCEESVTTNKKNHLLFVGPRGSGKTHFISMVVNRLKINPELQDKMIVIWLGEDDVITNLVDLALSIIENLFKTDPELFNKDCLEQAKGQKPDTVADIILHSISKQIGNRTILLVKENMSDVFTGLKDNGQKKLRAYLQEQNNIAILATSQQLFSGISSRDAAFFGFFDIYHLKVLAIDDARQLISNIATLNNNQTLVDFLMTPQGCYRIRALHHLAGGNHRLYVELAAFLTMESLDDFVSALTKLADSLTPYFQERVRSLPAQQAKIVQKLCELQGATPVKSIADQLFIGERSVAKQLGELAKKGYVISHKRGKQSYYEMAEPLMRLALEVKNNHGKPLTMVASLLRAWFSDSELQTGQKKQNDMLSDYKMAALSMDKEMLVSLNNQIGKQIDEAIERDDHRKVIVVCSEIISAPQTGGIPCKQRVYALYKRGLAYFLTDKTEKAFKDWTDVIDMQDTIPELKAMAILNRSIIYGLNGKIEKELQDLTVLTEMDLVSTGLKATALFNRGGIYVENGERKQALQDFTTMVSLQDAPKESVALALFFMSEIYFHLLKTNKAKQTLKVALEKGNKNRDYYPSNTQNILQSISQLGSSFWEKQINWIIPLYAKHDVLDKLGTALIHSISFFVEDESLMSSFKKWQLLWQQHGEQYQQMQISLQVLQAAVLAIEQKNDKPLFSLPKEVRELVLPLLAKVLNK
jgi:tetratricopeptide (TPR) repeat protein